MCTKVLLLDDDERYLDLLKMMLEGYGMEVVASVNGFDFKRLIDLHVPDVIVMDILMQEYNGVDLAKQYRELPDAQDVPIIFMSAWTGSGELKLPRNSRRVFKPFTQSELFELIKCALDRTKVQA